MTPAHVLPGLDDWLFLGEGTNFSISQVTGARDVDPKVRAKWGRAVALREATLGARHVMLICPEKSCIYPEFLPDGYEISPRRFAQQLATRDRVLYGLSDGRASKAEADLYPKTDTHFTEYGAYHVVNQCLHALGIDNPDIQPLWTRRPVTGDLGGALDPPTTSDGWFMEKSWSFDAIENGLQNRGRAAIYRNASAPRRTLLIFGDSFSGGNLARQFSRHFSEVTFVHTSAVDYEMVERLSPDFVITEHAERFLFDSPEEGRSFCALIAEKRLQGLYSEASLSTFRASFDAFKAVYGPAWPRVADLFG